MAETRQHVLIWIAPEFLKSSGMIQLFTEAGIFVPPDDNLDQYIRSAQDAGGFAMTGKLAQAGHGAGIWISPVAVPRLELMIPWQYVKSVVTAESTQSSTAFGLIEETGQTNGGGKQLQPRSNGRNQGNHRLDDRIARRRESA